MTEKKYPKVGDIVSAAGGDQVVADALGVTVYAVRQWRLRQIPRTHLDKLIEMCGGKYGLVDLMRAKPHTKENTVVEN